MKNPKGKIVIITGAGMGLGLATAKELGSRGMNLTLVDYDATILQEAEKEISKEFPLVKVVSVQNYGRIVNAASVGGVRGVLNQVAYVASKHAVSESNVYGNV